MDFPKQIKDIMYNLLKEPTLEKFREFFKGQTGEHNAIDFKGQWIDGAKLAKLMLSMANSQGGVVIFGACEKDDHTIVAEGIEKIKDHAVISDSIKNLIPSDLKYEVHDFSYTTSEYAALEGKNFQMIVIEDTPEYIPFLAKKDSDTLKANVIYVRRGTSCETANQDEIRNIINRRINYIHPLTGEPLSLEEHLKQLKILYDSIKKEDVYYRSIFGEGFRGLLSGLAKTLVEKGERVVEKNPLYPDEEYDEFVSRMISEKKKKIERVLDLH